MTLTGGLRDRMIIESVTEAVYDELDTLGWFEEGRQHEPIEVIDEYPDRDTEPPVNSLAVSVERMDGEYIEMGSHAQSRPFDFYFDFFAENDALGRHVMGDIADFIRTHPAINVLDYSQETPSFQFTVKLEGPVTVTKPERSVNPWQKHWFSAVFTMVDERYYE